jgi:hypothetical protein
MLHVTRNRHRPVRLLLEVPGGLRGAPCGAVAYHFRKWCRDGSLMVRFERKDVYFFGLHCLAFALINLRDLVS